MKFNVVLHADDYGFTLNTSNDIFECLRQGKLTSISTIVNTQYFNKSKELFYNNISNLSSLPLISCHINLVEGFCLSKSELLSSNGINNNGWGKLLLKSLSFNKQNIKEALKKEIRLQIEEYKNFINECFKIAKTNNIEIKQKGLRIDSHVHTHAIPIVFDALKEVIEEDKLEVEYIRSPKEPIKPFIFNIGLRFRFINLIKNIILNIYSNKIDRYVRSKGLDNMYLWGLAMSGEMDIVRIDKLYKNMKDIAQKHDRNLEILFHPGYALKEEYSSEINIDNFNKFNSSNNRRIEKDAVLKIKNIVNKGE